MDTEEHTPLDGPKSRALWFREKAQTRSAWWWLGGYSFFESVITPFPTDPFLAVMVFLNRKRALALTVFTTLTSVLGGAVVYVFAQLSYETLIVPLMHFLNVDYDIAAAKERIGSLGFFATFLGALTPIPYTPVALAAGLLEVNFFSFLVASFLGRGVRFGFVALVTFFWGVAVVNKVGKYATALTLALLVLAGLVFLVITRS